MDMFTICMYKYQHMLYYPIKVFLIEKVAAPLSFIVQCINLTTTASGVREQWVYPGYKNLYFEDGILVTIQD